MLDNKIEEQCVECVCDHMGDLAYMQLKITMRCLKVWAQEK